MNIKEYLSQARFLDRRISSKLDQIETLTSLAGKCTAVCDGMPGNPIVTSAMENTVIKIIDLQRTLQQDISDLIDLKRSIAGVIASVADDERRLVLEKRYLCFLTWEEIAEEMNHSVQHVHRLHGRALEDAKPAFLT